MTCSALLFGAALHPFTSAAPIAGGALGIAVGAAFGAGRRPRSAGARRSRLGALASLAISALGVVVAAWTARRIAGAQETAAWPPLVAAAVAAAAMGLVGGLATLPRHVAVVVDPVRAARRRLPPGLDAEVRALCDRAQAIWATARSAIADEACAQLVCDGALRTLEVAARTAELRVTGATDAELAQRRADLDGRIAGATDADIATQYRAARAALEDQQRYRAQIRQSRERLVARMHNHLAALEKFELAATGLEAVRAGAPDGLRLEALSYDVTASGDALTEIAALG